MACLMNVSLDAGRLAGWIPAVLAKCFRAQLRSAATQEERHVIEVRVVLRTLEVIIQHMVVAIELTAFRVETSP